MPWTADTPAVVAAACYAEFVESQARISLHLRCHVLQNRRDEFLSFLREAIPYYEAPGGIKIRLLEDQNDDHRFIELVLYESESAYERDQERVEKDPTMASYLSRWRKLLAEPPAVEIYRNVLL